MITPNMSVTNVGFASVEGWYTPSVAPRDCSLALLEGDFAIVTALEMPHDEQVFPALHDRSCGASPHACDI